MFNMVKCGPTSLPLLNFLALKCKSAITGIMYPCTGMQRIFCMVEKILFTLSGLLSVPCSEMMMDLWMSTTTENQKDDHFKPLAGVVYKYVQIIFF